MRLTAEQEKWLAKWREEMITRRPGNKAEIEKSIKKIALFRMRACFHGLGVADRVRGV